MTSTGVSSGGAAGEAGSGVPASAGGGNVEDDGATTARANTNVQVELPSDSEDEYPEGGLMSSYALVPNFEELSIRNNQDVVVMCPPRLHDDTRMPSYIEESAEGAVTVKLECMDTAKRVRTAAVMSMYSDDSTHFAKCMGFAAVLSDLMNLPKEEVAIELSPAEIQSWDWRGPLPKMGQPNHDQRRVMKGLHDALNQDRELQGKMLGIALSKLKCWRHQLRTWRQGRELYALYQHTMPGKTFDEIEKKMYVDLGLTAVKPDVDDVARKVLEDYRELKRTEERASRIANPSEALAEVVLGRQTNTADATASATASATAPGTAASASTTSGGATATTGGSGGGTRSSARVKKRPSTLLEEGSQETTSSPPKRQATRAAATRQEKKVAPKLVQNDSVDPGYTIPSSEWVQEAHTKLVLLKNLENYLALENLQSARSLMDVFVDELMGGGSTYDRNFITLFGMITLDQLEEPDGALLEILTAFKAAKIMSPSAISRATAKQLKAIVQPHDKSLKVAWMVKLCKVIEEDFDGLVPRTPEALVGMKVKELTLEIARNYAQEVHGLFYGPEVDDYYGCRMVVALELIDLEEHHFDKMKIDPGKIDPAYVRKSLLAWLPQSEWQGFHKLMVAISQLVLECDEEQLERMKKVIRRKFGAADKTALLGMVDNIIAYFDATTAN